MKFIILTIILSLFILNTLQQETQEQQDQIN